MSVYYDLFETPGIQNTGEPQPLYARLIPKSTIAQDEFIDRVHSFTSISHRLLQGTMKAFTDELCDSLTNGWAVEFGDLGYFTPSLKSHWVMTKKELRSASVSLLGLNFRLSELFFRELNGEISFERKPASKVPRLSLVGSEMCIRDRKYPCINRAQCSHLAGRNRRQAIVELNVFIQEGSLMRHGVVRTVVCAVCRY